MSAGVKTGQPIEVVSSREERGHMNGGIRRKRQVIQVTRASGATVTDEPTSLGRTYDFHVVTKRCGLHVYTLSRDADVGGILAAQVSFHCNTERLSCQHRACLD
jgi:hypothetical protein